jgi:hypothetical protein
MQLAKPMALTKDAKRTNTRDVIKNNNNQGSNHLLFLHND